MVSNPILFHQVAVLGLSGLGLTVLTHHLLGGLGIYGDVIGAFRLKLLGNVGFYAGIVLGILIGVVALAADARTGHGMTALAFIAAVGLSALGHIARLNYRRATLIALAAAEKLPAFEALAIYRAYATSFPNSPEPMTHLLSDIAGLRMLMQMHEEGVRFENKPIPEKVAEWCTSAGPDVIQRATEIGMFQGRPELLQLMEKVYREGCELEWEAILTRKEGAPMVGTVVRGMLEEALARQDNRLAVETVQARLDSTGRLTVHNLVKRTTEHFDRVRLKVVPRDEAAADGREPTYRLLFEVLESGAHHMTYSDNESKTEEFRSTNVRGRTIVTTQRKVSIVDRDAVYPLLTVRCSVFRNDRQIVSVQADSSAGLPAMLKSNVAKMGAGPSNQAANILFASIVQGTGMMIRGGHGVKIGDNNRARASEPSAVGPPGAPDPSSQSAEAAVEVATAATRDD